MWFLALRAGLVPWLELAVPQPAPAVGEQRCQAHLKRPVLAAELLVWKPQLLWEQRAQLPAASLAGQTAWRSRVQHAQMPSLLRRSGLQRAPRLDANYLIEGTTGHPVVFAGLPAGQPPLRRTRDPPF